MVSDNLVFSVPTSSVHVKAIDVNSVFGRFFDFTRFFFGQNLKGEVQFINGNFVVPSMSLETPSHKTLWEKES